LYDDEDVERSGSETKALPLLTEVDVGDLATREGMVSCCVSPFDVRDVETLSPNVDRRRVAGVVDTDASRGFVTGRREVERGGTTAAAPEVLVLIEAVATDAPLAFVRAVVDNRGVRIWAVPDELPVSSSCRLWCRIRPRAAPRLETIMVPNSSTEDWAAVFLGFADGPTVEPLLVALRLRGNSGRELEIFGIYDPSSFEVEPWPESLSEKRGKDKLDVGMEVDNGKNGRWLTRGGLLIVVMTEVGAGEVRFNDGLLPLGSSLGLFLEIVAPEGRPTGRGILVGVAEAARTPSLT
jgi:hypothetical protein